MATFCPKESLGKGSEKFHQVHQCSDFRIFEDPGTRRILFKEFSDNSFGQNVDLGLYFHLPFPVYPKMVLNIFLFFRKYCFYRKKSLRAPPCQMCCANVSPPCCISAADFLGIRLVSAAGGNPFHFVL